MLTSDALGGTEANDSDSESNSDSNSGSNSESRSDSGSGELGGASRRNRFKVSEGTPVGYGDLSFPLAVFIVSLLMPAVGGRLGAPTIVAVPSAAALGGGGLWWFNSLYRRMIRPHDDDEAGPWLKAYVWHAPLAFVASGFGAWLMASGAARHEGERVAIGLGLVVAALMVVAQLLHTELKMGISRPVAWLINATMAILVTGPAAFWLADSWSVRALLVGLAVVPWLASVALSRSPRRPVWMTVGIVLLASPVVATLFVDRDDGVGGWWMGFGALSLLAGVVIVTAQQRAAKPGPAGVEPTFQGRLLGFSAALQDRALRDRLGQPVVGAVGLVLVGFVVLWDRLAGPGVAEWVPLAIGLGGLAVGAALVVKGEGLLVTALAGFLIVWAVGDHDVGTRQAPPVPAEAPALLAFGDSYMSGEGVGQFYDDTNYSSGTGWGLDGPNQCRRSPSAYSVLLADHLDLGLWFYGCSGAVALSDELAAAALAQHDWSDPEAALRQVDLDAVMAEAESIGEARHNSIVGQLLRWDAPLEVPAARSGPELVLLSLGGNDAGFSTIGRACFLPGSCEAALEGRTDAELRLVTARVAVAAALVADRFPDTPIAIVAYPQMFGDDVDDCAGQLPFDAAEVRSLGQLVVSLNDALARATVAVRGLGATADVHLLRSSEAAFDGHRFCQLGADGSPVKANVVNSVYPQAFDSPDVVSRIGTLLFNNTFHPTGEGHRLLADALQDDVEVLATEAPDCHAAGGSEARLCAVPIKDPLGSGEGEVAAVAQGVCGDLDTYDRCALIGTANILVLPLALLATAGAALAQVIRRLAGRARSV